jgi:hypothetical protein
MNLFLTKEALYRLSYVGNKAIWDKQNCCRYGAGDETRTRDIQLGRLELYQLSYSRQQPFIYHRSSPRLLFGLILYPQENVSIADEAM